MLVWYDRGDGWQEAPAPPIRLSKTMARARCLPGSEPADVDYWVAIDSIYFIGKYNEDDFRGFRVGWQPKIGGCLNTIRITRTLGDARVEAETHYLDLCKVKLSEIRGPSPQAEPTLRRIKWTIWDGRCIEIWAGPETPRPIVWEIVLAKPTPSNSKPEPFVTCEFADERDPDFERLGEFATREEAEASLAADVRELASSVDHPRHYSAHPSGIECIEIAEYMNFCRGNALKYLWRADEKGSELEDLKKARWYLDREIARLEKGDREDGR